MREIRKIHAIFVILFSFIQLYDREEYSHLTDKVPYKKLTFSNVGSNLADLLATITFETGIYIYELWDDRCRGVLIMASVNNYYGVGIYLSYYSSNNFERVENVNRTFTISPL